MLALPLLSIAIPTWNRASYLRLTLEQLHVEMPRGKASQVEILVSDNCSDDDTAAVVESVMSDGLRVRYVRNKENIGSDRNIAQCFNLASGRYVLLLGDDDILIDGTLPWLLSKLSNCNYGVVFLRPYGYNNDFRAELPSSEGDEKEYSDASEFLTTLSAFTTLISTNVIYKEKGIDALQFCGDHLVQTHLIFRAALSAKQNLYTNRYMVAYKRNNSGGYDFSRILVEKFGQILDQYCSFGLSSNAVEAIENRMLMGYYPFYIWRQRLSGNQDMKLAQQRFGNRFAGRILYVLFVAPIFNLPRSLAIVWGVLAVGAGRVLMGDLRRGFYFAWHKMFKRKKLIL
ncbi:MAG: glycosyltransferase family 2 protein [Pseudomonadota bacterium]